jgi:phosphoribosyl 1,2-cyclic phosphodiesterase
MIEAMTNGGFKKKGVVFVPGDALNSNPIVFTPFKEQVEKVEVLHETEKYKVGNICFETPVKHVHGVETYGLNVFGKNNSISLITDTQYFDGLESYYNGDVLILNVVLLEKKENIMHLSLDDVEKIISINRPKLSVLTHFGMNVIRSKPWEIAAELSKKIGVEVVAASDGMEIKLD